MGQKLHFGVPYPLKLPFWGSRVSFLGALQNGGFLFLGPAAGCPFPDFFGFGGQAPSKIDYRKNGTLILSSLLEDLVVFFLVSRKNPRKKQVTSIYTPSSLGKTRAARLSLAAVGSDTLSDNGRQGWDIFGFGLQVSGLKLANKKGALFCHECFVWRSRQNARVPVLDGPVSVVQSGGYRF